MDDQRDYAEEAANRAEMRNEEKAEKYNELAEKLFKAAKTSYAGTPHGWWTKNETFFADIEFPDMLHAARFAYISDMLDVFGTDSDIRDAKDSLHVPVVLTVTKKL